MQTAGLGFLLNSGVGVKGQCLQTRLSEQNSKDLNRLCRFEVVLLQKTHLCIWETKPLKLSLRPYLFAGKQ